MLHIDALNPQNTYVLLSEWVPLCHKVTKLLTSMATFKTRKKKDGTVVHVAQIRINKDGKTVFSEAQSFTGPRALKDAKLWAGNREQEVKLMLSSGKSLDRMTVAQGIERYLSDYENAPTPLGRTKRQTLRLMAKEPILQNIELTAYSSAQIVEYFKKRYHQDQASPATVMQDVAYLRVLFKHARAAWSMDLDLQLLEDAIHIAKSMGLADRGQARDRRVTLDELDKILGYELRQQNGAGRNISTKMSTPLTEIVLFAIFSTRRLGEIVRMQWDDIDFKTGMVYVRDLKHPRDKKGNNVWLHIPARALEVIKRCKRVDGEPRIFPLVEGTVGNAYRKACNANSIEDLTFHDLRHEGVSHLFEIQLSIPEVSLVSGHRSWSNLSRYTHLTRSGYFDKYDALAEKYGLGPAGLVKPA